MAGKTVGAKHNDEVGCWTTYLPSQYLVYPKIPQEENTYGSFLALAPMIVKEGGVMDSEQCEAGIQISGCGLLNE